MSTMSLPNFGAEASLYRTKMYYYGLSNGSVRANRGVVPSIILCSEECQLVDGKGCVKYCMNCSGRPGAPFCDPKTLTTKLCSANECQTCGPCTCTKNCGGVIEPC
jgi:hypothetical protein